MRLGQALVVRLTWRELLFRAAFASASSFNLLACRGNILDEDINISTTGKYAAFGRIFPWARDEPPF